MFSPNAGICSPGMIAGREDREAAFLHRTTLSPKRPEGPCGPGMKRTIMLHRMFQSRPGFLPLTTRREREYPRSSLGKEALRLVQRECSWN